MNSQEPVLAFTSYQKFVIALLALMQFTVVLDFMVLSPLGDILMKSLNITPSQFGVVVSAYAFSAGASGIMAAGFADRYDRKKLLLFFYIGFVAGTLFCGLAPNYEMLLAARIVTGLFGGVIGSVGMAIITDLFALNQRGRVMGFTQMALAASQILGIPVGLYFANIWGWHAPFLMIVSLALVIGLAVVLKMQPITKHLEVQSDKNALLHLWHTVTNPEYRIGFIATAFMSVGGFMMMPFGSAYLINNIKISQAELPFVFMLTGFSSVFVMPLVGRLSDRGNKFKLFTVGSALAIVMTLIYSQIPPLPLWQVVIINILMVASIMSRMIPATTLTTTLPELRDRGAFMSITSSLQQMAGGMGAVSAGMIIHQATKTSPLEHYDTLGYVVSGFIIFCVFLMYLIYKQVERKFSQPVQEVVA